MMGRAQGENPRKTGVRRGRREDDGRDLARIADGNGLAMYYDKIKQGSEECGRVDASR